jgi:hypothetical protein
MDEIKVLVFGVLGGVLGSFFKFWIEDLRGWSKSRLTKREKTLLQHMNSEQENAFFEVKNGEAPFFQNRMQNLDRPGLDFRFYDNGETKRLIDLGLIDLVTSTNTGRYYRLTGRGYSVAEKLPIRHP